MCTVGLKTPFLKHQHITPNTTSVWRFYFMTQSQKITPPPLINFIPPISLTARFIKCFLQMTTDHDPMNRIIPHTCDDVILEAQKQIVQPHCVHHLSLVNFAEYEEQIKIPDSCLLESGEDRLRSDQGWQWQALVRVTVVERHESCAISLRLCPCCPCPVLATQIFHLGCMQIP